MKKDLYILGAGFSWYAGLPLQREFTKNLLQTGDPHQVTLVQFLRSFINKTFDHNIKAASKYWPELEDIFTCIDLSANTGHTLGLTYDASHLRTVRRALISRMIRMLDDLYLEASREARPEWKQLDRFFRSISLDQSRFITLNWDTVVERGIRRVLPKANFDYGSGAEPEDFNGNDIVQVKLGKEKVTRSKDSWFSQLVILRQLPLLVLVSSRKIEEYLRSDTW